MALWLALSLLALAGWMSLVFVAIDSGQSALDGDSPRWWLAGGAVVGAIVLLLVAVALVRRLLVALGLIRAYVPKRARR